MGQNRWPDDGQGDGVPKACHQQAAADSRGSRTCVCANTSSAGWHMQGEKDELTSCRGTVQSAWQYLQWVAKEGEPDCPQRVSGRHVVRGRQSSPIPAQASCVSVAVRRAPGKQARLVKTVNIQVKWAAAHPGQDRRLPSVATHSRLYRATSVRSRVGIVLEDGSGVAIDWVTGRSYSSARRRLNVQSGQRKGRKGAAAPYPSVAVRDRGHWKGVAGSGWARRNVTPQKRVCFGWKGVCPGVRFDSRGETVRSPKNTSG